MARIILKTLMICFLFFTFDLHGQEIWNESFSVPEKGIRGSDDGSIYSDFDEIYSWSISYNFVVLEDANDYAKTVSTSGGRFEVCDIDGEVVWRSEEIDITDYDNVYVELTVAETGSGSNTQNKYLKVFYQIDGSNETPFDTNAFNAGNWGTLKAVQDGLTGGKLQIICYISTHYAADKVILDEVTVRNIPHTSQPAIPYDVVINELMVDPNPAVELPDYEYIELYNRCDYAISLENWSLKINELSKKVPSVWIEAHGYLLLSSTGAVEHLNAYGKVSGIPGFQGLINRGASVELLDESGFVIDHITYSDTWYDDADKSRGGWSLERIDPYRHCNHQGNWTASVQNEGGTPGYENSVFGTNSDTISPYIKWAVAVSGTSIEVVYSETINHLQLVNSSNYKVEGLSGPIEVDLISDKMVILHCNEVMVSDQVYKLSVMNVEDECHNQLPETFLSVQWNENRPGDVVLNEVLFNPMAGGAEFIELYNNSNKLIDLSQLVIARRNKDLTLMQISRVATERRIFYPNSYLALTPDTDGVVSWSSTSCSDNFLQMESFPILPNAEGTLVLANTELEIFDEFCYNEKMHSPMLAVKKGVSLERITYDAATNSNDNWQSAAGDVGYSTPGCENSQAGKVKVNKPVVVFEPESFSPNYDGYNDDFHISYELPGQGFIGNIKVFDSAGRFIHQLARNELLGRKGLIIWDGNDETGQRLAVGVYIVVVELFNLEGDVFRYKEGVVLTDNYQGN